MHVDELVFVDLVLTYAHIFFLAFALSTYDRDLDLCSIS